MPTVSQQRSEIELLEESILRDQERLTEMKRAIPPTPVEDYMLQGWDGPVRLSALFRDRRDLIVVHNMGTGCAYCTLWADGFNGVVPHLEDRAGFAVVSPDPPAVQKEFALGRGWRFRMASGEGSTFIQDMGFRGEKSWLPGVSTFRRDDRGGIVRVAKAPFGPGDPFAGIWHLFALLRDGAAGWKPKYRY
ncbi:MAG TPA: DUF899 family protein [Candidatus Eisenbacteria bacterium]